jgi:DNA repair exonuclease SbcCD ATPase subunit
MHTAAQDAAARHADDIMTTVRMEREEMAREREAAAADRERLQAEQDAARLRAEEECQAKISALEEELARVREELENERQQRITEEAETRERERMEALERDEAVRNQLGDITNLVQDQREECARKKELMDERWAEKQTRRGEKDSKMQDLYDMVAKIVEDREADKIKAEEERLANEGKPGKSCIVCPRTLTNHSIDIEKLLEELQKQNAEQRELLNNLSESE